MKPLSRSTENLSPIQELFQRDGPKALDILSERQRLTIKYLWRVWARPNQLLPKGDWRLALWCCGRGYGKTRVGAEATRYMVESGQAKHVVISSTTAGSLRDICIEGESGILSISPPWFFPTYEPSKRRLTWPNGARAVLVSSENPDLYRGLQADWCWSDELAAWRYPESFDQLMFGLRLGSNPRGIITTTPRPTKLIKGLIARDDVNVITGTSFENRANLAPAFFDSILARYAGSRLAEQEIYARVLESTDGAIVNHDMIDKHRVTTDRVPEMVRVLVAVDPAVSSGQDSDSTGIVVCGLGVDDHVYILDDRTCKMSPEGWTRRVVEAMGKWKADRCIGEINNGGALIEACLRAVDKNISYQSVTASRGKHVRFEPVGSLFEQGRIHMVGQFPSLEDQVVLFTPEGYAGEASPDACDALVWGVTSLVLDKKPLANVWSL